MSAYADEKSRSPSDDEKAVEYTSSDEVAIAGLEDPDVNLSEEERQKLDKQLLRKLDLKLIPWLTLLYLVSFLDRTNIGNAKVDGLTDDLHMSQQTYNTAVTLFFVSYSVFEPLTNVLLKRFRPKWFLSISMTLWGICMTSMGLVHNFQGLAAARFFLGLTEAGLFPGINFFLGTWYTRGELGRRAAIFFSAAAVAGSFGGLLAAAIAQMDGIGGKPGWAWIFILEGLATVLIGIATYWMVHDFPDQATFLSPDDLARVRFRLAKDKQASAETEAFNLKYAKATYKDWKTYAYSFIYSGADMPLYAFSLFIPSIIKSLGYSGTKANLLSVPPYAVAAILTVAVGFLGDRTRQRALLNMGISSIGIAGFIMLIASTSPAVKYAGVFLAAMGIYPCIPNTIVWASNNFEGVYKRGVAIGTLIGYGNLNGVISSNIYDSDEGPQFYPGHGTILGFMVVFLFVGSLLTRIMLDRENKARKAGKRDYLLEGKTEEEIRIQGDIRPDFMYTL